MDTNDLFQLVSEVREDLALPDGYTSLYPHTHYPMASIVYTDGDPIPDLPWDASHPDGIRIYRIVEAGAEITIQAPAAPIWGRTRDVFAAPSPNDTPKTYTYEEAS